MILTSFRADKKVCRETILAVGSISISNVGKVRLSTKVFKKTGGRVS